MSDTTLDRKWLYGPIPDLFLGCGLGYAVVFLVHALIGAKLRVVVPENLLPLLSVFISAPHYGATLVRVYERARDRRVYALFATWVTLALAAWFVWGLYSITVGSLLVTVYLTWSPWHYSAQNYGIALMFLRRRGVEVTALAKRLFHASFALSYGLAFLSLHGGPQPSYVPNAVTGFALPMMTLGIPDPIRNVAMAVIGGVYAVTVIASLGLLLRHASLAAISPAIALVGSQALWFSVPVLARNFQVLAGIEPLNASVAQYAFLWIAFTHAIQYVWISTYYYATSVGGAVGKTSFVLRALFAGVAAWTLPAVLFAPGLLGHMPYEAGLGVLVASVVNVHHFILDGVIWKLRYRPVASVLLRAVPPEEEGEKSDATESLRRRWRSPRWIAIGAVGALCLALTATALYEEHVALPNAAEAGDLAKAERIVRRLDAIGRGNPAVHFQIGMMHFGREHLREAERWFRSSLALYPTSTAWMGQGFVYTARGELSRALTAYDAGLTLDPRDSEGWYQSGKVELLRGNTAGAVARLEKAMEIAPTNQPIREALALAHARAAAE